MKHKEPKQIFRN